MIKISVLLDGNKQGCCTFICNETMKQFIQYTKNPAPCIALTEKDTNNFISIPIQKYIVIAEELDEI